ncbi:DNA methyltransferase [Nonomuraea sp. B19D2]|uniref:Eco57I restriction-modification methylase domain-containing protein n=1 Tax=Nonomuraea sp. B19D2 TaxID=3159561 RepID=UPI0032DB2EB2
MKTLDQRILARLDKGDFQGLFLEELLWDPPHGIGDIPEEIDGTVYVLRAVSVKHNFIVFACDNVADADTRNRLARVAARRALEHLLVFTSPDGQQEWRVADPQPGNPHRYLKQTYQVGSGHPDLAQRLAAFHFPLDEQPRMTMLTVRARVQSSLRAEQVSRKFFESFKVQHKALADVLENLPGDGDRSWYASILLDRMMFLYFIQKKGFLDRNVDYLRDRLEKVREQHGPDQFYGFYRNFLLPLFHVGLGDEDRASMSSSTRRLIGDVPYLNGGIFSEHSLEGQHHIDVPDAAFEKIFDFFDSWRWHLDERPGASGNEINPEILGYIFERYINQKQMGAYYTREDVTSFITQNSIGAALLDWWKAQGQSVSPSPWSIVASDPQRYMAPELLHGLGLELPPQVAEGIDDPSSRESWDSVADSRWGLEEETWREVVRRRSVVSGRLEALARGEVTDGYTAVRMQVNTVQLLSDSVFSLEDPALALDFYKKLTRLKVLDPTCGSGAFLFAALTPLKRLYDECLDLFSRLTANSEESASCRNMRAELDYVASSPNRDYFIYKQIILNNLHGVDIMVEAVEVCKLRLFLKLVAQLHDPRRIEPLPDIDFNIRAGNTLVGYTNLSDLRAQVGSRLDFGDIDSIESALHDLDNLTGEFRAQQAAGTHHSHRSDKQRIQAELEAIRDVLDRSLVIDYGRSPKNIDLWRSAHNPFHWCVEFHEVMASGGFDVIVGNPPYKRLAEVKDYQVRGYETIVCKDLYPLVMERAEALCAKLARIGWIVPISSISTGEFVPLQRLLSKHRVLTSCYDDRPDKLFKDLEHIRLAIHLIEVGAERRGFATTRYQRWRASERESLFPRTLYTDAPVSGRVLGCIPKLGDSIEHDILGKLWRRPQTVTSLTVKGASHRVFYTRKMSNFVFFLKQPPIVLENDGNRRDPSELKFLAYGNAAHATVAQAVLNSNLFFWFLRVHSDCRNLNRREIEAFPCNLDEILSSEWGDAFLELSEELDADLIRHSEMRKMGKLTIQCFLPVRSKSIIDHVDRLLASHYGLSDEELDWVVNFDLKYRIGSGDGDV